MFQNTLYEILDTIYFNYQRFCVGIIKYRSPSASSGGLRPGGIFTFELEELYSRASGKHFDFWCHFVVYDIGTFARFWDGGRCAISPHDFLFSDGHSGGAGFFLDQVVEP